AGDGARPYRVESLRPLAEIPGVRLISLQLNEGTDQLGMLPVGMSVETLDADYDKGEHGFLDAVAAMQAVDLVVSCDTSMAHLAGALGRPVWIALNEAPEWRWQRDRSDNIWYPTARLFRQDARGDWDGVFVRMAQALVQRLTKGELTKGENGSKRVIDKRAIDDAPGLPPRVEVSWGELLDKVT